MGIGSAEEDRRVELAEAGSREVDLLLPAFFPPHFARNKRLKNASERIVETGEMRNYRNAHQGYAQDGERCISSQIHYAHQYTIVRWNRVALKSLGEKKTCAGCRKETAGNIRTPQFVLHSVNFPRN